MISNKAKFILYKILICILVIIAIVIIFVILRKQFYDIKYDKENREIAKVLKKQVTENKKDLKNRKEENVEEDNLWDKVNWQYKGYDVIGLIEIPNINLEYPIISETTKDTMKISITRFSGGNINEYGNLTLVGHNNYNKTMFGRNSELKVGDIIYLTDTYGRRCEYKIYNIFVTTPDDTSILEKTFETTKEITLITCKDGRSKRLIIKAKEKI